MQNTQHKGGLPIAKLALALDTIDIEEARKILDEIKNTDLIIKVGYALFIKYGSQIVDIVKERNFELFLDLKLHDIPNTVYNGVLSAVKLGVDYLTIHTLGGKEMLDKAVQAKANSSLKLLGVTILTSHTEDYLEFLETKLSMKQMVLKLAKTAIDSGIDGIVCSPQEVKFLKENIEKNFIAVVPGIRPEGYEKGDQKRTATPAEAVKNGADIIVVGRPILKSDNKNKVIKNIIGDIERL